MCKYNCLLLYVVCQPILTSWQLGEVPPGPCKPAKKFRKQAIVKKKDEIILLSAAPSHPKICIDCDFAEFLSQFKCCFYFCFPPLAWQQPSIGVWMRSHCITFGQLWQRCASAVYLPKKDARQEIWIWTFIQVSTSGYNQKLKGYYSWVFYISFKSSENYILQISPSLFFAPYCLSLHSWRLLVWKALHITFLFHHHTNYSWQLQTQMCWLCSDTPLSC